MKAHFYCCGYMKNISINVPQKKFLTLTNFSDGAKQPTHKESRIQPRAWLLLDGFWVSCLQI